jgi:hypothetical protein
MEANMIFNKGLHKEIAVRMSWLISKFQGLSRLLASLSEGLSKEFM